MYRKLLPLLIMLGLSAAANADFRTISEAHEVDLANLRLPLSEFGTLSFRLCPDCAPQTSRVTRQTRYTINNRTYTLADFRAHTARLKDPATRNVSVIQHLESNTIEALEIWVR